MTAEQIARKAKQMTDKDVADEFIALAERVTEHAVPPVKAVDCAIQDDLGFNYGQMESEHLPLDYDRLHAKLVTAMFNGLPTILTALRQPATERADAGGLTPSAWRYGLVDETGDEIACRFADGCRLKHPFGEPGLCFSPEFSVTSEPLYPAALKPAEPAAEVEELVDRIELALAPLPVASPLARDLREIMALTEPLAAELTRLQAENARLVSEVERMRSNQAHWFYYGDDCSSDQCRFSIDECISEDFEWDHPQQGDHVLQISGARPVPDMWVALHYFTEAEKDERQDDHPYEYTVHATEAEARTFLATLGGSDA